MRANFAKLTPRIMENIGSRTLENATRLGTTKRIYQRVIKPILYKEVDSAPEVHRSALKLYMELQSRFYPRVGEELTRDRIINGIALRTETRVFSSYDGSRWEIAEALLCRDEEISGVKFSAGETAGFSHIRDGNDEWQTKLSYRKIVLPEDREINGIKCQGGKEVFLSPGGEVILATLAENQTIRGIEFHKGTQIEFLQDGELGGFKIVTSSWQTIWGICLPQGTMAEWDPVVSTMRAETTQPYEYFGKIFAPSARFRFHLSGSGTALKWSAVIAADMEIDGVSRPAGTKLFFDAQGQLIDAQYPEDH